MGIVFLSQAERDNYTDYVAPREMIEALKKGRESVQANAERPRIIEYAREKYLITRTMFATYLNENLCRIAAPGQEIFPADVIDVDNLLPVIMVWRFAIFSKWQEEHNPSGVGRPQTPQPNPETLCWLLGYVYQRNYPGRSLEYSLPKFTDEAQKKIQKTCWTDAEIDEQRMRMNYPKWDTKS